MKRFGIKYTHDAAIACIDGNKLLYSIEAEKVGGADRFSKFSYIDEPFRIAYEQEGDTVNLYSTSVDGWALEPIKNFGEAAPYSDVDGTNEYMKKTKGFLDSYQHITNHITAAYSMSNLNSACYVLLWDGGYEPTLFLVNPDSIRPIIKIATVSMLKARIYNMIGHYFGPFKDNNILDIDEKRHSILQKRKDLAGKLMSYAGLGKSIPKLKYDIKSLIYNFEKELIVTANCFDQRDLGFSQNSLLKEIASISSNYDDATIVRNIHEAIIEIISDRVLGLIPQDSDLIFTGGAALNIKLNSTFAKSSRINSVFVPPTCNDSGNAIGAACTSGRIWNLDWTVYSGPKIIPTDKEGTDMSPSELGEFLANNPNQAVVVLHDRAEIGPRALGHRSLLMSPQYKENKEYLNKVKKREPFRPVAPIALLDDAIDSFHLTTIDPYMLFDHKIKNPDNIPAIDHADNTARVQVVDKNFDHSKFVLEVLTSFKKISGIGILCNTSANRNGSGFFHSVDSAIEWAKESGVNNVWSNNKMYNSKEF